MSVDRDAQWHQYVLGYDIDGPQDAVDREAEIIRLDLMHRMQYSRLSGGEAHLFPKFELESQQGDIIEAATFEAKEPIVLRDLVKRLGLTVSRGELEDEAIALAQREGTSLEDVKRFFGEDLSMLERDVLNRKAREWALSHV